MIYSILQIFIIGIGILIVAIVVNIFATLMGLETWYSFIIYAQKNGLAHSLSAKWPHLLFLVFIYPFILGLTAYYLFKLLN